jgi:hydroxyacylglutathione hydrolase
LPLDSLRSTMYQLDPDRPTVVYCASGNRSFAAMSLLAANGFRDVSDLVGGYRAFVLAHGLRRAGADR